MVEFLGTFLGLLIGIILCFAPIILFIWLLIVVIKWFKRKNKILDAQTKLFDKEINTENNKE